MQKIVGIVTAFYPDWQELGRNIQTYLPFIDILFIADNTPEGGSVKENKPPFFDSEKIKIIRTGENEGLGNPFNNAIQWAEDNSYDYLLTMDQDSYFAEGDFAKLYDKIKATNELNIAVFSPNTKFTTIETTDRIEVESAISSGAIYPINVFKSIGRFHADYFVYMIDIEFCFRASECNYKIVQFPQITMNHQEGYAKKTSYGITVNHYSAQSTYYIIRNTLLTWKLHPTKYPTKTRLHFLWYKIIFRTIKMILENNRLMKLKALFLGLHHGLINKSGKYNL